MEGPAKRPVSTTSSQLSISDRMTDGDEDNISLNILAGSSCSSTSLQQVTQQVTTPQTPQTPQRPSSGIARTTTISTIAVESNTSPPGSGSKVGSTRLVIALLQTPHRGLQLKVIELNPSLLKLPDNLPDAEDFCRNHEQVIKNLQSKQSPVEELLRQADSLIASQKPRAEVYCAMADSLGFAWRDLNAVLEERKVVIHLALAAHQRISDCLRKMDEVHSEYSKMSYVRDDLESMEIVASLLQRLKIDRTEVLRRVAQCLETCDQLLHKISEYNYSIDSRELVLMKDVEFANRQVQRWLERLHDRRVILEERLRNKREELEELTDNSKYDKEIQQLEIELGQFKNFSKEFNFGDSVPSAERRKEHLNDVDKHLKILQERALNTAKRLEDLILQRAKFTQRIGLKTKVFEILSETNDLLTEVMDLDLSLSDAKEFFRLADIAKEKLDAFSVKGDLVPQDAKNDLNQSVQDALSKGESILNAWGWDSPKTKGVRDVHDSLLKTKEALLEELDHLKVLDEYNHFLECVNQTYQNVLNIQNSSVRQPITIPTARDLVCQFKSEQEKTLGDIRRKLGLDSLMTKLQNIYPDLSEEEKCGTEVKINELKGLSNLIVELLLQRIDLASKLLRILELYQNCVSESDRNKIKAGLDAIVQIQQNEVLPKLAGVHQSDPDLNTWEMENEIDRVINDLRIKLDSFTDNERIREICHKYKVKLDHHLLGDGQLPPQFYPLLTPDAVAQVTQVFPSKVAVADHLIHKVIKPKLENVLSNFFQPLITSYRQEILDTNADLSRGKSPEETDLERYCCRLKESYVTVANGLETYIKALSDLCQEVEEQLRIFSQPKSSSVEDVQRNLAALGSLKESVNHKLRTDIVPKFDQVLQTVRHEEPPQQGCFEQEALASLKDSFEKTLDFCSIQETMDKQLADLFIANDLLLIGQHIQHISNAIDHSGIGNSTGEVEQNMKEFTVFEKTTDQLQDKLIKMLSTSPMIQHDQRAQTVRKELDQLMEKRSRRKELLLKGLEYFRLIDESHKHYDEVNRDLLAIQEVARDPELPIAKIEDLLRQLQNIKGKEAVQEGRLCEIERLAKILFEPYEDLQHLPLREKNQFMTAELQRVESDLTGLLGLIKGQKKDVVSPEVLALEQLIIPNKVEQFRTSPSHEPPIITTTTTEIKELQTLSLISTTRRSPSPLPPTTVEKETQFEEEPGPTATPKVDRDTVTQTVEEKIASCETQTEVLEEPTISFLRPPSRPYEDPEFVESLKDVTANEGDRVVLECRATGRVKRIIWLKDGMEVTNNPDYKSEFSELLGNIKLTIEEAFHVDSAVFTCRAIGGEDDNVVVETSGKLIVREPMIPTMQPPRFLPHPPISSGVHGKSHVLQLQVEGNPLPTVQWFRNGQCIDTSPDYIITFNNGTCQIQFDELLKELDEGIYTCFANNKVGEAETHVELHIQGDGTKKSRQKPKIIRPLPKSLMCRAGQPLKLQCEFESTTECNVLWWKDGKNVLNYANSSAHMKTEGNIATLTFSEVYPVDSGRYAVLIRNAAGECQSAECQVTVKGLLPPETSDSELNVSDLEIVKPVIKMQLKDFKVRLGDSVKLDCVIVAQPEPEVIWYRNDVPIKESPNHHLVFQGDRCALNIKSAAKTDEGKYTVKAVNSGGEVKSSAEVTVIDHSVETSTEIQPTSVEKPRFSTIIQDQMVTEGDKFRFIVELDPDCDENTQVTWYKSNQKIEPGEGFELLQEGKTFILQFDELKLSDRGNYLAKASNASGDTKCFACLIVKENRELQQKPRGDIWEETVTAHPHPTPTGISRAVPLTKPPRFVVSLEGKMVDDGDENVVLKGVIESHPPADLKWTRNNDTSSILPSPNLVQRYNEKTGEVELLFKTVRFGDVGRYTCTASNHCGLATSVCDLVVKKSTFPPVFSKRLQSLTLEEGKRLYLEVDVFGKPNPEVSWMLNSQKIESSPECIMKSDTPTRHALIIPKVTPFHHGEFSAVAKNEAGEMKSTCSIAVIQGVASSPTFAPPKPISIAQPTPATSTQAISRKEFSLFESSSTYKSSFGTPLEPLQILSPTPIFQSIQESELLLERGPEPEILVAPPPAQWKTNKNQVLEKVKTFEEQAETPDIASPPSGGIRLIPMKEPHFKTEDKVTEIPILPLKPFPFTQPQMMEFEIPSSAVLLEKPKRYQDSSQTSSKEEYLTDHGLVTTEKSQQSSISSSEVNFFRPSKFVRGQMRESDYESDFEGGLIPPKWTPTPSRDGTMSPTFQPVAPPPMSAFASCKPSSLPGLTSSTTTTSMFSEKRTMESNTFSTTIPSLISPEGAKSQKPTVPPKPRMFSPPPSPLSPAGPSSVRQFVKSWPPQETQEIRQDSQKSSFQSQKGSEVKPCSTPQPLSLLSPRLPGDYRSARSPTPSREALEMEKQWSRPIRFSSPTKSIYSPVTSPQPPMSPRYEPFHSPTPPLIPPKPRFVSSPRPFTPEFASPQPKVPKEPLYYVSVVSTPRETPVPPAFSPPPEPFPSTETNAMNFHEKKEFFEQCSNSYSEDVRTSSYHHQSSMSSSSQTFHRSTQGQGTDFPLLDSSFLPPPGEAPEFLFAPPPQQRKSPGVSSLASKFKCDADSGSSPMMSPTPQMSSSSTKQPPKKHEIRIIPPTPPVADTPTLSIPLTVPFAASPLLEPHSSKALIPYIKPSKFTPKLDYAASLEKGSEKYDISSVPMRPKWNPKDEQVRITTWKRVSYEPPPTSWKEPQPRRNSLTIIVDERMQDLNRKFKDNISLMTQGLCYNKLDRKMASQLEPSETTAQVSDTVSEIEANPLIYFKYDFGYEFGIADPKSVIRASSEPPSRSLPSTSSPSNRLSGGYIVDETGVIHLPIIHEKSSK